MNYFRLLALVLAVNVCAHGRAQTDDSGGRRRALRPEGTAAFRSILHHFQLKPIANVAELASVNPAETVIVVLDSNEILTEIGTAVGGLKRFQADGGAVLVATDRDSRSRLDEWDLAVAGIPVVDPRGGYREIHSCPQLLEGLKPHPLFEGFHGTGLATNHPSFLQRRSKGPLAHFDVIARFGSDSALLDPQRPKQFKQLRGKPRLPYIVASRDPDRILVVAGHGVFMNMMLAQPDNDNMIFAFNCVRWLSQAPDGSKRKHALFVENGTIAEEFDAGLIGAPRLPLPPTQVLNRMIRGLEEEDFFNRLLAEFFTRDQILRAALLFCTAIFLLYGGWRLIGGRQRSEAAVPLPGSPMPAEAQEVLNRRRQAMADNGNFAEAAVGLLRSFFAEYAPGASAAIVRRDLLPPFQANGRWMGRLSLMRQVSYLWRIATEQAGPVSARQLKQLPPLLDRVATAIQQDRLIVNSEG